MPDDCFLADFIAHGTPCRRERANSGIFVDMLRIQEFEQSQKAWVPPKSKTHDPKKNTESDMVFHFAANDTCIRANNNQLEELQESSTRQVSECNEALANEQSEFQIT